MQVLFWVAAQHDPGTKHLANPGSAILKENSVLSLRSAGTRKKCPIFIVYTLR